MEVRQSAADQISVRGALTFPTARRAREEGVRALSTMDGGTIQVDCREVNDADSAGLAVLLDWLAFARSRDRTIRFLNLPAELRAVARISEVDDLLTS